MRSQVGINSLLVQMAGNNKLDWRTVEHPSAAVQPQQARP
jgi:hypothetical protein